ncbi:hypothetical protein [Anaerocellum danielii]|uniref:Uncharacterized protein n=1 Tax=Anaerocellum danielii TaxID=1387557 RepID=A0ABZ0U0E8_9FIRM|nr:hypothetical protein [Caldicellulosiruptor danielii]WPX08947.1 hypothetical protein SOJ16_000110 [Caldicellulosiruptor danielii]
MSESFDFDKIKKELMEKIKKNEIEFSAFQRAVEAYKELGFELEKILEYAANEAKEEDKKRLWALYKVISQKNIAELCDSLSVYGESLKNSKVYERFYDSDKKIPSGIAFRALELTRLGKREEVFHIILREFVTSQQQVDENLAKAFNPRYSIESFKTLIYSFFSGLLG